MGQLPIGPLNKVRLHFISACPLPCTECKSEELETTARCKPVHICRIQSIFSTIYALFQLKLNVSLFKSSLKYILRCYFLPKASSKWLCITFALVGMPSQHQDIACFLTTSSIPKALSNEWTDLDQTKWGTNGTFWVKSNLLIFSRFALRAFCLAILLFKWLLTLYSR